MFLSCSLGTLALGTQLCRPHREGKGRFRYRRPGQQSSKVLISVRHQTREWGAFRWFQSPAVVRPLPASCPIRVLLKFQAYRAMSLTKWLFVSLSFRLVCYIEINRWNTLLAHFPLEVQWKLELRNILITRTVNIINHGRQTRDEVDWWSELEGGTWRESKRDIHLLQDLLLQRRS